MKKWVLLVCLITVNGLSTWAGDYVFVNTAYLKLTEQLIDEADIQMEYVFKDQPAVLQKYSPVRDSLNSQISTTLQQQRTKKITADKVNDVNDKLFSDTLNSFKDALNLMSDQSGKPLDQLLPSYSRWTQMETAVVKTGLDQRLTAFNTRFGVDSEPINIIELLIGEKYLPGDESGPSSWEPIVRFSAVSLTNAGSGITSTMQLGLNHYFVKDPAPQPFQLVGINNHVGVAAVVQYLEDPHVFNFKGRPSYGISVHLDRKEAGLLWDTVDRKVRLTVGYSFQFIPFVF